MRVMVKTGLVLTASAVVGAAVSTVRQWRKDYHDAAWEIWEASVMVSCEPGCPCQCGTHGCGCHEAIRKGKPIRPKRPVTP